MLSHVELWHTVSCCGVLCYGMLSRVVSWRDMSCRLVLCYGMLSRVILWRAIACRLVLCYGMPSCDVQCHMACSVVAGPGVTQLGVSLVELRTP